MPATLPDVIAPLDARDIWLAEPETKARMQRAASNAVADVDQHILNSRSLYVPRQISEREDGFRSWLDAFFSSGFEQWLDSYKDQLTQKTQEQYLAEFPEIFAHVPNKELIRETVETLIWPVLQPQLKKRAEDLLLIYAVRGIALLWVNRNLGDGLLLGLPEIRNDKWYVPLHDRFTQQWVADVVLNHDGELLVEAGELRAALGLSP